MPDLLVRGVDEETKRALAIRAARNSRSVQAEALDIITRAVRQDEEGWFPSVYRAMRGADAETFCNLERHAARETAVW